MRNWLKRLNEFLPSFKEMIENREWLQLLFIGSGIAIMLIFPNEDNFVTQLGSWIISKTPTTKNDKI
jgi:hypothetical protein